MKHYFGRLKMTAFMLLALCTQCIVPSFGQTAATGVATYKVSNPNVVISGSYTQPYQYAPVSAGTPVQIFPYYTKTDTVTNTGVDTAKGKIAGPHESVYTWVHVTNISGTNTGCVVKLWASGDSSKGVDFVPIYTATVSATNPVGYYLFTGGWPYTNFWWTFTGSGTQSSSWYSGAMVR